PSKATLDKALGPQMANLLRHGVLPVGGVELEFRYRGGRLVPQVSVEPAFLLVHMPQLDSATQPSRLVELAESRPASAPDAVGGTPSAGAGKAPAPSAAGSTGASPAKPLPTT